ncbi:MAG: hypothetical protein LBU66_06935 [Treponema sp.]|jgi:tetratricopeptide (TPR) repeat protein|nr:hypothetical protein [Treponema sp.]
MVKRILKILVLVIVLTSCASTIRIQVARIPTLDTSGIRRIAIIPFGDSGNEVFRETAQYASSVATNRIFSLNHFTIVDPSIIEHLKNHNENIEGHVDALFSGQITRVDIKDSTSQLQKKDKEGNTYTVTIYNREVEIEFNYYFTRARDGSFIGPVFKKGSSTSSNENFNELRSVTELVRTIVDDQLRYLNRDMVPYTVIENRRLATEKSKDKELKALMKDAHTLVKEGNYRSAIDSYLGIYQAYKNIAAALNAGILYEAVGETQAAADLLRSVYSDTGNPRANVELSRLHRILADQAAIASNYTDARSFTEIAAEHAINEIQKILPVNARVWIYNNSSGNPMIEAIVDNITADFIRKRISLVDRENTALIEAEQRFQMSGHVSDNDFTSIGNAIGANTIVIIAITGTGEMRRLQVRVLDIEKSALLLQSDTRDAWKL